MVAARLAKNSGNEFLCLQPCQLHRIPLDANPSDLNIGELESLYGVKGTIEVAQERPFAIEFGQLKSHGVTVATMRATLEF